MPSCQGIDAGQNRLKSIDVSHNPELVELYINDNAFTEIDLSRNPKLKYFYCHNNHISALDTRTNPLLRQLPCGSEGQVPAALAKVLENPEMAALLKTLAKSL